MSEDFIIKCFNGIGFSIADAKDILKKCEKIAFINNETLDIVFYKTYVEMSCLKLKEKMGV